MKKTFQLFLFASLLLLGGVTAWAQTSGPCGTNATWSYDSSTKTLTISGTGAMTDYVFQNATDGVSKTNAPWSRDASNPSWPDDITKIVIGEGITNIGNYAFISSTAEKVELPTTLETIGSSAFQECSNLKYIIFPASLTTIDVKAFFSCSNLEAIVFQSQSVPQLIPVKSGFMYYYPFIGIKSGATIYYPEGGQGYESAVYGISSPVHSTARHLIPDDGTLIVFGTSTMPSYGIGYAPWYSSRSSITRIVVNPGVPSISSYAFYGLTNATSISIPASVTSIGNGFIGNCTSLQGINVDGNNPNYTSNAANGLPCFAVLEKTERKVLLAGCKLSTIPSTVTTISNYAFTGLDVTGITIPSSVTTIGQYAFSGGSFNGDVRRFEIPSSVNSIGAYAFNNFTFTTLDYKSSVIPTGKFSNTTASTCHVEAHSLDVINSFKDLGYAVDNLYGSGNNYYWYYNSTGGEGYLTIGGSGELPNQKPWSTRYAKEDIHYLTIENGIHYIPRELFLLYTGLKELTLNCSTSIEVDAFEGCTALTKMNVGNISNTGSWKLEFKTEEQNEPDIVGQLRPVTHTPFYGCSYLHIVNALDWASFLNCCDFSTLLSTASYQLLINGAEPQNGVAVLPNGTNLSSCGKNLKFANVTSVDMSQVTSTSFKTIDNFKGNTRLTSVILPPLSGAEIASQAFRGCTGLQTLVIPSNITEVGEEAFSGCTSLTELTIQGSSRLDSRAFNRCEGLRKVNIGTSAPSLQYTSQKMLSTLNSNVEFYVYYGPFYGCTNIETVNVASLNAYCNIYGVEYLSLTSYSDRILGIMYPQYKSYKLTVNGEEPANGKVAIPAGTARLYKGSFKYCNNVTSLVLPVSTPTIDEEAIGNTVNNIECLSSNPSYLYESSIGLDASSRETMTLTVPFGSKAAYQNANYWKEFGTIEETTFVTLSQSEMTGDYGTEFTALTATCFGETVEVSWTSSNENVATVEDDGTVTITATPYTGTGNFTQQTAVITATVLSGTYQGQKATCVVNAIPKAVLTDGATYSNQTAAEFEAVTYTRHFKNTSWQAWYVPFDVVLDEDLLEEYDFSRIEGVLLDGEEWCIGILPLHSGETVKACVPYLVRAKVADDADTDHVLTLNETTLYASTNFNFTITSASDEFKFTGIFAPKTSTAEDIGWYGVSTSGGFTKITKVGTKLGANRFFLTVTERADNPYATNHAASSNLIRIREIGDATSLETFVEEVPTDAIFGLRGNKVDYPTESGIYIVNGKKIYLK